VLIGAVAFLVLLAVGVVAGTMMRRLNGSLRETRRSLQAAVEERRGLEVRLRNSTESSSFAQASAGVATFDVDVPNDAITCSGNYFEFLSIPVTNRASDRASFLARIHPDDLATVFVSEDKKSSRTFRHLPSRIPHRARR